MTPNTRPMVKLPFKAFIGYLKTYLNAYDKEQIVQLTYNGEINKLSREEIDEIVCDFLDTVDEKFIWDYELFFVLFHTKPFYENGVFIGELSSSLSEEQIKEFLDYSTRSLN